MNIESIIRNAVEATGKRYVHVISPSSLDTMLSKLTDAGDDYSPFVVNYVSSGSEWKIDDIGVRRETSFIQMLMADRVALSGDAEAEADSVSEINETQKQWLYSLIDEINSTGDFNPVSYYKARFIPIEFNSICACMSIEFQVTERIGECVDE